MEIDLILWSVTSIVIITILIFIALWLFGSFLYNGKFVRRYMPDASQQYIHSVLENLRANPNQHNSYKLANSLSNYLSELLEKRNDFWTTYGQMTICIFIIGALTILLLTKTISPEAGLPILSAISGFAIANRSSKSNNNSTNDDPKNVG